MISVRGHPGNPSLRPPALVPMHYPYTTTDSPDAVAGCTRPAADGGAGLDVTTQETPGPPGGGPSGTVRLLIVDDHDMFADSLRLALSVEEDMTVVGTAPT